MNDPERSLLREVLLPIESPQAVNVAELLAEDLPSAFWRVILTNIVDEQDTAMSPALICPFLVPLQVRTMLAPVTECSVASLADVGWGFLAMVR